MPSVNAGKIITKIKINKNDVSLYFGKKKIVISNDAYLLSYLYVGKSMSGKEISALVETSKMAKLFNYATSLLKKARYSEWKIREKLYAKEAKKSLVNSIIKKLKEIDLINDAAFIEDYLGYAEEKGYGKNRILKELQEKGIFSQQLRRVKFSESSERKKAREQVLKNDVKMTRYSFDKRKQRHYQHLLACGFDSGLALDVIDKAITDKPKQEQENLKKDYERVFHRLTSKYEGEELKRRLFTSLKNKGYRYHDILKIMEEKNYADD
ncbi:MAG: regulatory protein RecX [Bacilli bacterium]|nr:regulatory protein RecX [Bacilli bacterium]